MKFGDFLRQQREKNQWTQPEAALKIEIEQSYLSKLETGKSYPSEDIFTRLTNVYQIDSHKLNEQLFPAELDKLREIKQIRNALLSQEKTTKTYTRTWLLIGLGSLMLAGLFIGAAISSPPLQMEHLYRSQGVILDGEPLNVFDLINKPSRGLSAEQQAKQKELLTRIHQSDEVTTEARGSSFIRKVFAGKRFYDLYTSREVSNNTSQQWFLSLGLMFLLGGLASFFVSRSWK